jgi:hypothetical protein
MNVEGQNAQGVVQVRWLQVGVLCTFVYFHTHLGAFGFSLICFHVVELVATTCDAWQGATK